jgi:hypothetical protein
MDLKNSIFEILTHQISPPRLNDNLLYKYTFEKTVATILREFNK